MCKAKSFLCVMGEDSPRWSMKHDSHYKLIEENGFSDSRLENRNFVKVEYYPKNNNWFSPSEEWVFLIDEECTLPLWFDKEEWENKCRRIIDSIVMREISYGFFPGDLYISSNDNLKSLKTVGGNLFIYSDAKLDAPVLKTVGGNLYIYSNAKLDALKTVGGDLSIKSNAKLDAPALKTVGGDLSINSDAKLDALKTVGGDLYINSDAKLDALKTVGGDLYIYSDAKLDALKTVGGDLFIYPNAKLDALKTVGGDLFIYPNAKLDAPKLKRKSNGK